jgi:hypothetical protein
MAVKVIPGAVTNVAGLLVVPLDQLLKVQAPKFSAESGYDCPVNMGIVAEVYWVE